MTKQHSKDFWFSYKVEGSNYASGDGVGVAGAMAKMTTSGTAFMKPTKKPIMPYVKWTRAEVKSLGDDEYARIVYPDGKEVIDGEVENHLQASTWLTNIMLGAAGAIPTTSYTFHWQHKPLATDLGRVFESYGVLAKKWHLSVVNDEKKLPTQTTTFLAYDTKTETGGADAVVTDYDKLAFLTTAPCLSRDVTITIEGAAVKYKTLDVDIEKIFDTVIEAGGTTNLQPRIVEYKVEIAITFQDPLDTIAAHELVEADTAAIDVVITMAAPMSKTLTASNMRVDTADNEQLPEFGMVDRTLKLVPNTGFTWVLT